MTVKSYIHLNQMYSLHKDVYACTSLYKKDCIFDRIILHGCGIVALMVFFRHKKERDHKSYGSAAKFLPGEVPVNMLKGIKKILLIRK